MIGRLMTGVAIFGATLLATQMLIPAFAAERRLPAAVEGGGGGATFDSGGEKGRWCSACIRL